MVSSEVSTDPSFSQINKKMCSRCICDTSIEGISFDSRGECNFCQQHDLLDKECPNDGDKLQQIAAKIKSRTRHRNFNCIVGISGGRDSIYTLYLLKKILGLNPLAVHFNDGFGNPVAGENIRKATKALGVEVRTVTSDWRESKDLKIAFLKASTPDLEQGTDIGIATALFSIATQEKIPFVLLGISFRTEGISPLSWNYLDGRYLKDVHRRFGNYPLRSWRPEDAGFNLGLKEMCYYTFIRKIRVIPILYYAAYNRDRATDIIKREFDWEDTGAHYFDDLYQSLMSYVLRTKFGIDRRLFNLSALIRSGQIDRDSALKRMSFAPPIEDQKTIELCIKRLGLTREDFEGFMRLPPKTFRNYRSYFLIIRVAKYLIKFCCSVGLLPASVYAKYFLSAR